MKLFGKQLFQHKKDPVHMYDFAQHGLLEGASGLDFDVDLLLETVKEEAESIEEKKKKLEKKKAALRIKPKKLYDMGALNDNEFKINIDPNYIDNQVSILKNKLNLLGTPKKKIGNIAHIEFTMEEGHGKISFAIKEVKSLIERLENRKKIKTVEYVLNKYPHTTSKLVYDVLKNNKHLKCEDARQFVPDLPSEATRAMEEYEKMCIKLCNKKPIFYIIADKKDFEKVPKRRDPILLAQSPFGFFWQILGAWDEEDMIFLGDL